MLGSELKLASAEFETNGDQQAFLTAKSRTLRSEIAQQEEIVKSLEGAVKDAGEKYGETAKTTDDYQIRLNGAERRRWKVMRRELDATDREAQDLGRDSVRVGRQIEDGVGDGAEQAKESLESMAAQMKQSLEEIKNSSFVTAAGSAWNMAQGVYQGFSGLGTGYARLSNHLGHNETTGGDKGNRFFVGGGTGAKHCSTNGRS